MEKTTKEREVGEREGRSVGVGVGERELEWERERESASHGFWGEVELAPPGGVCA